MLDFKCNESILSFTDGITATSANHLCNVAKETYAEIEERHKNIKFYEKRVESLSSQSKLLSHGQTKEYLTVLKDDLKTLTELKSFIAYFKEAIKLKEATYELYRRMEFFTQDYYNQLPENPSSPRKESLSDYIKRLPIKEYNRYLTLETKCAVFGSFVHPDGGLSKSRKDLMRFLSSPTSMSDTGNETLITSYIPTVELPDVDKTFFEIQKEHRSCQAEFNKFKSDLEEEINRKYADEYVEYQQKQSVYQAKIVELRDKFYKEQNDILEKIQKLKIIVPDNLKSIQTKLSSK